MEPKYRISTARRYIEFPLAGDWHAYHFPRIYRTRQMTYILPSPTPLTPTLKHRRFLCSSPLSRQIHKAEQSEVAAASGIPGRFRGALYNHVMTSPELADVMQHSSSVERPKERHAKQNAENQRMAGRWDIIELAGEERSTTWADLSRKMGELVILLFEFFSRVVEWATFFVPGIVTPLAISLGCSATIVPASSRLRRPRVSDVHCISACVVVCRRRRYF